MLDQKSNRRLLGFLAGSVLAAMPLATARADVVAYYSFDNTGDLGHDDSGNGFDLTTVGAPTAAAGATASTGGGVSFDGVDDQFYFDSTGAAANIYAGTPELSVSFFAKLDGIVGDQTISRANSSGGLTFINSNGEHRGFSYTDGGFDSQIDTNVASPTGVYEHLAFVFEDADGSPSAGLFTGTVSFYLNGTLVNTVSNVSYDALDAALGIGGRSTGSEFLAGDLDEFAVYDQALTQAQVTGLANGTLSPSDIPEPASLALLGLGGLMMATRRRFA